MPCDTRLSPRQTLAERMEETRRALKRLEQALVNGQVRIRIGPGGAVAFTGWTERDRDGLSDVCAYRILTAEGSSAMKRAVFAAEAFSGQKVNAQAVASGVHSHDGGKTWGSGH